MDLTMREAGEDVCELVVPVLYVEKGKVKAQSKPDRMTAGGGLELADVRWELGHFPDYVCVSSRYTLTWSFMELIQSTRVTYLHGLSAANTDPATFNNVCEMRRKVGRTIAPKAEHVCDLVGLIMPC